MPQKVFAIFSVLLLLSGCFFRDQPEDHVDTDGGDSFDGDFMADDGGDSFGTDDGPGDSDGGDDTACDETVACAVQPCQTVVSCNLIGGEAACQYDDMSDDSPCDLSGSPAGSADGICMSGECIAPGPVSCRENSECAAEESCIDGLCLAKRGNGGACDVINPILGDSEDCAEALFCEAGTFVCLSVLGESCASNEECLDVCVDGLCAPPSDYLGICDAGEDADCAGSMGCPSGTCLLGDGESCTNSADCAHACVDSVCAPFIANGDACTEDGQCEQGGCNHDFCGSTAAAVFVVEVEGHYAGNTIAINEIAFYDAATLLTAQAQVPDIYDSTTGTYSYNWPSANSWGYGNLTDGEAGYVDVASGQTSSTLFCLTADGDFPDVWARFGIFLPESDAVSQIRLSIGNPHGRIPYAVRIYRADYYDFDNQLAARSNEGLTLVGEVLPTGTADWVDPDWVIFNL